MGMIGRMVGVGRTVTRAGKSVGQVAEVFVGNKAERDAAQHERFVKTMEAYTTELEHVPTNLFDRIVNAMNRLPRPILTIGTIGLFVYSMVDPIGFSLRMEGLGLVPSPLWWLMGAIVSFYFGARELHYFRQNSLVAPLLTRGADGGKSAGPAVTESLAGSADGADGQASPFIGSFYRRLGTDASSAAIEIRASDPNFNAALEEWRLSRR